MSTPPFCYGKVGANGAGQGAESSFAKASEDKRRRAWSGELIQKIVLPPAQSPLLPAIS